MKITKSTTFVFLILMSIVGCKQHSEARRPISHSSGSFMKKSAERNIKLVANEESQINTLIKSNPNSKFIASKKGYWYAYDSKNETDSLTPKKGDIAYFNYTIKDLKGNTIYSELELQPQTYAVDKQDILMGLRDGIKLMHKKEKITFLFPSHMAYGYHGDNKKIGVNQSIQCIVTLHDFKSEVAIKKEKEAKIIPATKPETTEIITPKDTLTK
jgi:gliding motility-associated peptidyl-prolyl isomerase